MDRLSQDERFTVLLHKKIMNKSGAAKRRAKKYYKDQYKKTGLIPKPLLLAEKGILEGRKCSGRKRVLDEAVKKRLADMIKASSDLEDPSFIYITQKARTLKNYHRWIEEEFGKKISLSALRRFVRQEGLGVYVHKPDFEEDPCVYAFKACDVFDLVQMDGCQFQYLKIRDETGAFEKPRVIEVYDTGSRYMFDLEAYFSESSLNAVDIFTRFLTGTPFPPKTICLRPDNARGFLNLKRAINALNISHSLPGGFFLKPDFSRINKPKDKAHLESSHRSLHNFEIRIIKTFAHRIAKIEPGYIFKGNKKRRIMVTVLDIGLEDLRKSGLLQAYCREHNASKHHFTVDGRIMAWVPAQMFEAYLARGDNLSFSTDQVKDFMKYGYEKIKATVSSKCTLVFQNQQYHVVVGADRFDKHQGTKVHVSQVDGKLLIFEHKPEGILIGEAVCQAPYEGPESKNSLPTPQLNELERIARFLEENNMKTDIAPLVEVHRNGLSLDKARIIYEQNKPRYERYMQKLRQPAAITAQALFRAFILDAGKHLRKGGYQR